MCDSSSSNKLCLSIFILIMWVWDIGSISENPENIPPSKIDYKRASTFYKRNSQSQEEEELCFLYQYLKLTTHPRADSHMCEHVWRGYYIKNGYSAVFVTFSYTFFCSSFLTNHCNRETKCNEKNHIRTMNSTKSRMLKRYMIKFQ
jgi:hypothetical protein